MRTNEIRRVRPLWSPYVRFMSLRTTYGLWFVQGYSSKMARERNYCIAALATWSVKSAAAMMTAKPVENFTNSTKNGSIRRLRTVVPLFL